MKFEDKRITFEPTPLIKDPYILQKLISKREDYFTNHRPSMDGFEAYSKEEIEKDKKELERLKSIWKEEETTSKFKKDLSSVFEGAIFDLIEANNFLGENSRIVPASEWDDIKNGVDGVFVFDNVEEEEDFYGGIEVDVTFASEDESSSKYKSIEKKVESIKECIRGGILPTLKYFRDPKTNEHKIVSLPKVVIGIQQSSAEGLVRLWGSASGQDKERLKNHPIQSKIIWELLTQLEYFFGYSKYLYQQEKDEKKRENAKIICRKYGELYNYILSIFESKKDLINSHWGEISSDKVFMKIIEITQKNKGA